MSGSVFIKVTNCGPLISEFSEKGYTVTEQRGKGKASDTKINEKACRNECSSH